MARVLAFLSLIASPAAFHSDIRPLDHGERTAIKQYGYWHRGCPTALDDLRLLEVSYRNFDNAPQTGQIVVNKSAAHDLSSVFGQLYATHFRIRHMAFSDMYGPVKGRPRNGDVTQSFSCRQAVPSPCTGGKGTGTWSNHAYGLAVDVNPLENPYVGCGQSRDPKTQKFFDRSHHRRGMIRGKVRRAFAGIGWGWGGSWTGDTKDYMHFSFNGH